MGVPFNEVCTLYRPVRVPGSRGGYTETHELVGTFACRENQPSSKDRIVAGNEQSDLTAVLYADPEEDVRTGDVVLSRGRKHIVTGDPVRPSIPVYQKIFLKAQKQ